jgi:hypothetical protein
MKISKAHQNFADHLDDQTALEYPEYFLGPNWKDVLNFWIYLDTLSVEECKTIFMSYHASHDGSQKALSWKAARDTISHLYVDKSVTATCTFAEAYATFDLIGSHKLETLNFLPLFLKL